MIIPGSASQSLGAALSDTLDRPMVAADIEQFPDGELLVTLEEGIDGPAIVVAATVSSRTHIELLLLQDAVYEAGATDITTVIPYLGYARQDKAFDPGQPISVRAMAKALSNGTDRVLTVDPHEPSVTDWFSVPAAAVTAAPTLAAPLPRDLDEPMFLAPDAGAIELAQTVHDAYGRGAVDHLEKTRRSSREVEVRAPSLDVDGCDVIVVDDIISTGGTMVEAIRLLLEAGATRVYVATIHALLVGAARTRLAQAGVEAIIATDTIERSESVVSAAPVIADWVEGQT